MINLKFKKVVTSLFALFPQSINKNSKAARLIVGTPSFPVLSFSKSLLYVYVFCLLTPFISVLFAFHRKILVLLHLMKRYTTSTSE